MNLWTTYKDLKLLMPRVKTNVGTLMELTKGKVASVSSKKLSFHDVQKVAFPLNENM
jgi:hypothetical protein